MYCKNCGAQLEENFQNCPRCGCKQENGSELASNALGSGGYSNSTSTNPTSETPTTDQPYESENKIWFIPGIIMPILGFVFWFIKKDDEPKNSRYSLYGAFIGIALYVSLSELLHIESWEYIKNYVKRNNWYPHI